MIAYGVVGLIVVGLFGILGVYWPRWRKRRQDKRLATARRQFQLRREWLEANFLKLASESGVPRGLTWVDCDFENAVAFARDKHSGQLRALVGVAISFEAIDGGGLEDNPNVGNLRAATAVFRYEHTRWETDGRAVFNLNPAQTIQKFTELEVVDL